MELKTNVLYYGDNLDILRKYVPDDSIDLIYLDPPFNSKATYNVLFRESSGAGSGAQIEAFEDTWHWGQAAQAAYEEVVMGPHQRVARMLQAMVEGLGHNDVTAYLCMMAIRLVELHRVLSATGSIYLHCDPTAGPYLRVLMDSVFGAKSLRNEIVWKRSASHGGQTNYHNVHDILLFFSKSSHFKWNATRLEQDPGYVRTHYYLADADGRRYQLVAAHGSGQGPARHFGDRLIEPPRGRHWMEQETIDRWMAQDRIVFTKTGMPRYKRYLDETPSRPIPNVWTDIPPINSQAKERLGYPTQKPLALLERIVSASSNPSDIVLDPFCGCGTAVHAAQKLGRRWIGIDITHLAIGLVRRRMQDAFPGLTIEVVGEPKDLEGARYLASSKPRQFEYWVVDKLDAQPTGGKGEELDGVKPFIEFGGKVKRAVISVKGTRSVNPEMIRELLGALDDNRPIGILAILSEPTKGMVTQAVAAGSYESAGQKYPRVQIITVDEALSGKRPHLPSPISPFAKAPKEKKNPQQEALL
jgi:DNA modification methylase